MDKPYVIAGWYTPDYKHHADRLIANLDEIGEPHDIVEVSKISGGWEKNTLRKAQELHHAFARNPRVKSIIFLDVDCEVRAPLDSLIENVTADIALYPMAGRSERGTVRILYRSGTIVAHLTEATLDFIETWGRLSAEAPYGAVDQHTLPQAIAATPWLAVQSLPAVYCATPEDNCLGAVIRHGRASKGARKVPKLLRRAAAFWAEETRA
jgi:hypothetical protein